jgi:uncharacterized SAM-binding protein YcdF (DUF218 family)
MFFILSKIFHFLVSPLSWIVIVFLAGFIFKEKRQKLFIWGITLLLVFTNPFLINYVMNRWEVPSRNSKTISEPYEGGIVLGGAMRYYNSTMQRPVYGSGVDRFLQAIELYKSGKIRKIILSGGSGLVMMQDPKESTILSNLLIKMGIPQEDILVEIDSRNTYENAVNVIALLKTKNLSGRYLLITSGYHMRRSLGCFEKAGFHADPYSVDERSGKGIYTPDKIIIPEAENLESWDLLMHEWVGYITYKMVGYI